MPEAVRTHRLAAILSADVAGYSRLIHADEAATVDTLQRYRAAMGELAAKHGGRVVNTPGDALLAEFPSALEALAAAIESQETIEAHNRELPEPRRMHFRIGLNLGDVLVEADGTLYGDGVNIAARMEALADPGGIVVSGKLFDEVSGRVGQAFDSLGEQTVKNIDRPVRAYRVRGEGRAAPAEAAAPPWRKRLLLVTGFGVLVLGIAGALAVWAPWKRATSIEPASVARMAQPLPTEPSIAVLPFDNLSGGKEHEYIADGLAENIIAALSQTPQVLVIARNSAFTYKGKPVDVRTVAEEQGVQYVLEGSVQVQGKKLRATAQLIDALKGQHVWSERYDRPLADVFAVQDEITLNVVSALQGKLTFGPQAFAWRGGTKSLEAWSLVQQGIVPLRRLTPEDTRTARPLFERAVKIDPDYALAWVYLGYSYLNEARFDARSDFATLVRKATEHNAKAHALDPQLPDAYAQLALIRWVQKDFDGATSAAEEGIRLGPNHSVVLMIAGNVFSSAGELQRGLEVMQRGLRLSPVYPPWYPNTLARAYFFAGSYEEAIFWARESRRRMPHMDWDYVFLVASYAALGRLQDARQAIDEARASWPGFSIQRVKENQQRRAPMKAELLDKLIALLRKAGLPETAP